MGTAEGQKRSAFARLRIQIKPRERKKKTKEGGRIGAEGVKA